MITDYRLRYCLFKHILDETRQTKCLQRARRAMIIAAVSYRIEFGTPKDLEKSMYWMARAIYGEEEMNQTMDSIRNTTVKSFQNAKLKELLDEVRMEFQDYLDDVSSLDNQEEIYKREIADMEPLLGSAHYVIFNLKHDLARVFIGKEDYERAAEILENLILNNNNEEYGPGHPSTISLKYSLSATLLWMGEFDKAEEYARQAAYSAGARYGLQHPLALQAKQVLASAYRLNGQLSRAERLQSRIVERRLEQLGPQHPTTLQAKSELAEIFRAQGIYPKSYPIFKDLFFAATDTLESDEPDTLRYKIQYGAALNDVGRYREAEAVLVAARKTAEKVQGESHFATLQAMFELVCLYTRQGRLWKAERIAMNLLQREVALYGPDAENHLHTRSALGQIYIGQHRTEEAVLLLDEVVQGYNQHFGGSHHLTLESTGRYISALAAQQEYEYAEELATSLIKKTAKKHGKMHPVTLANMQVLVDIFIAEERFSEAEYLQREVLKRERAATGKNGPGILHSLSSLSNILYRQGKLDDAEKMALEARRRCTAKFGNNDHPDTMLSLRTLAGMGVR
jgi:tetratricopeptide (TPR) repeat protein